MALYINEIINLFPRGRVLCESQTSLRLELTPKNNDRDTWEEQSDHASISDEWKSCPTTATNTQGAATGTWHIPDIYSWRGQLVNDLEMSVVNVNRCQWDEKMLRLCYGWKINSPNTPQEYQNTSQKQWLAEIKDWRKWSSQDLISKRYMLNLT